MSNERLEHLKQLVDSLTPEQLEKIGGGDGCTLNDLSAFLGDLQRNYDALVDFTSYVIERVVG